MASLENKLRRGLWSIADGHAVSCLRADCRSISKNRLRLPTRIGRDRVPDSGWNHFGLSPGPRFYSPWSIPSAFIVPVRPRFSSTLVHGILEHYSINNRNIALNTLGSSEKRSKKVQNSVNLLETAR